LVAVNALSVSAAILDHLNHCNVGIVIPQITGSTEWKIMFFPILGRPLQTGLLLTSGATDYL